jgi:2',3'-cyclic-nucleotide 2'-phosphodiesterase (5'-nucleotidase family)
LGAPYQALLTAYLNKTLGQTTVPLDGLTGFTQETNAGNLETDAALEKVRWLGIDVDFHLAGALANTRVASTASPSSPVTLTVNDAFTLMPSDYSLVVLRLNGPQLKAILERSYRNYYYYKYIPGYGGYTYATACLLDINKGGRIVYRDSYPGPPDNHNVMGLYYQDGGGAERQVDFTDTGTYYHVSTLNYLVSGACNFNDYGQTLWPLSQVEQDTGVSLRDAVIDYLRTQTGPIAPGVEGRLQYLSLPNYPIYLPLIRK